MTMTMTNTATRTATRAFLFATSLGAAVSAGSAHAAEQRVGVVFFTEWSALLDPAAQTVIQEAKTRLGGTGTVTVMGYADTTGSSEANDLLSKLRAQMVIDRLVADGVPAGRLKRADRGATPDIGGLNESRRVVISIGAD